MDVFTNVADVPLDTPGAPDVVDKPDDEKSNVIEHVQLASVAPAHLVVPFHRTIKNGTKGRDVVGAKRAIWAAVGLKVPVNATQLFGPVAVQNLKWFQNAHGIKANGILDSATLAKLGPYFDAFAFLLYEGYPPTKTAEERKRNQFVAYMLWGYNNRGSIHYAQQRPMDHLTDLHFLPVWDDCSEFFTKGARYAGFKDPNGQRPAYNGLGWTGTLAAGGRKVAVQQALPGDGVLYGPPPNYEHVAGYIGQGRVISHGSEGGPYLLPYDYRKDVGEFRSYV